MLFRCAAGKDEPAVTIAAIDIAAPVNLQPDAWVAQGRAAGNVACSVTGHAAGRDGYGFGLIDHGDGAISNRGRDAQPDQK